MLGWNQESFTQTTKNREISFVFSVWLGNKEPYLLLSSCAFALTASCQQSLQASERYPLHDALEVCRKAGLDEEEAYLLGRDEQKKEALHILLGRMYDVRRAVEFIQEHQEDGCCFSDVFRHQNAGWLPEFTTTDTVNLCKIDSEVCLMINQSWTSGVISSHLQAGSIRSLKSVWCVAAVGLMTYDLPTIVHKVTIVGDLHVRPVLAREVAQCKQVRSTTHKNSFRAHVNYNLGPSSFQLHKH